MTADGYKTFWRPARPLPTDDEAFETMIPRNVRLSEAPSYGLPIHLYDARCSGTQSYRELAKELIRRNEG